VVVNCPSILHLDRLERVSATAAQLLRRHLESAAKLKTIRWPTPQHKTQ